MRVLVHSIEMGDVEDPEIYAADPIIKFEKTEQGLWLKEHSYEQMEFIIRPNSGTYGFIIYLFAWLRDKDLTYYSLKWGEADEL